MRCSAVLLIIAIVCIACSGSSNKATQTPTMIGQAHVTCASEDAQQVLNQFKSWSHQFTTLLHLALVANQKEAVLRELESRRDELASDVFPACGQALKEGLLNSVDAATEVFKDYLANGNSGSERQRRLAQASDNAANELDRLVHELQDQIQGVAATPAPLPKLQ